MLSKPALEGSPPLQKSAVSSVSQGLATANHRRLVLVRTRTHPLKEMASGKMRPAACRHYTRQKQAQQESHTERALEMSLFILGRCRGFTQLCFRSREEKMLDEVRLTLFQKAVTLTLICQAPGSGVMSPAQRDPDPSPTTFCSASLDQRGPVCKRK